MSVKEHVILGEQVKVADNNDIKPAIFFFSFGGKCFRKLEKEPQQNKTTYSYVLV